MPRQWIVTAVIALATGLAGYGIGRSTGAPARVPTMAGTGAPVVAAADSPRAAVLPVAASDTVIPAADGAVRRAPARDTVAASQPVAAASRAATGAPARPSPPAPGKGRRRIMLGSVDLTDIGYDRGNPDAPLVLIDFSDFACPYCGRFSVETYPEIEKEYVRTGKVFFKYVPFLAGFPRGREATRAAECAADQGKFWVMSDSVYASAPGWKRAADPHAELLKVAATAGLDTSAYWACYSVHRPDARTRRATDIAEKLGVRATPSFALNGRPIEGALPLAEFRRIIDAALLLEESRR